jgi:peptide/nickel transport system substrate-binding protein
MRSAGYWARASEQRLSRRAALRGAGGAAAALGALAIVGCDGGGGTATPVATVPSSPNEPDILNPGTEPRYGGRLVTANSASFGTWDPHKGIAVASAYFPRIYNVLLNQSPTKPEYIFDDLAQSYEIPDETTFIFTLRPGVKIAPNTLGVPERDIDAEDARVTFERLRTDPTTTAYNFAHGHIESVTTEEGRVVIKTKQPYAWFLNQIGAYTTTIPPRELLAGDPEQLRATGVGGGAYSLRSVIEEDRAMFDRNPNYYRKDDEHGGAQLPYFDGLEVRVVFDKATQLAGFQSGQFHMYMTGHSSEANALGDYPVARDPNFTYIAFTMNPEVKPFDDPRVRRAVSRAINRQQFVDLVYQGDARPDGIIQWSLGAYALSEDALASTYQPFDLDEARRLVDEVGGIRLKMMYPVTNVLEHDKHVPVFVSQMRAAGIEVEQEPQDFIAWVENVRALKYECTLNLNQIYETPEFPLALHTPEGPFGDGTFLRGLPDAEIEAAVDAVNRELDVQRRIELAHDAQKIIYEKDPVSLALVTPYSHFVWRPEVKNIPTGVGTTAYFLSTSWLDG